MLTPAQLRRLRRGSTETGNKLRLAIEITKTTQVQVAAAVGVAQSQISEDAAGKFSEISLEKARAYARYFGCAIEDLFPSREAVAS